LSPEVVVTYRTPTELAAALAFPPHDNFPDDIIVVDNGAADGEPAPDTLATNGVRILRPEVRLRVRGWMQRRQLVQQSG
jgi:GT2 family glycosyltransferase